MYRLDIMMLNHVIDIIHIINLKKAIDTIKFASDFRNLFELLNLKNKNNIILKNNLQRHLGSLVKTSKALFCLVIATYTV